MGLLLKVGINIDLIHSALIAFLTISSIIILINKVPEINKLFPNYSLQLGGLIGNTSFLGIPIAIALLPTDTINHTIGFDLGTTLFSWIFGPYLLQNANDNYFLNFKKLLISILSSPASRGIIGVLIIYLLGLEDVVGNFLWLPARVVISIAIIVVGSRLGIIANNKKISIQFEKTILYSVLLKLLLLPVLIYLICQILNFQVNDTVALVLQAATPSAISTILMAEAYQINRDLAAKTLFITTLISVITIPLLASFIIS